MKISNGYKFLCDFQRRLRLSLKNNHIEVLVFLSIFVGFELIVSIGPSLQYYFSNLLLSDRPSIYETACSDCIVVFPSPIDWLKDAADYFLIIASAIVVTSALLKRDLRSVFVTAAVASFGALSVTDLVSGNLNVHDLVVGLSCNALGSPILGAFVVMMVIAANKLKQYSPNTPNVSYLFAILAPVIIGLAVNLTTYFMMSLFYKSDPFLLNATASGKLSGYYRGDLKSKSNKSSNGGEVDRSFGLFSDPHSVGNSFKWTGMSKPLTLRWKNSDAVYKYDLYVSYYGGCFSMENVLALTESLGHKEVIKDIKNITLQLDSGLASFEVIPQEGSNVNFSVGSEEINSYSILPSDSNQPRFMEFSGGAAPVSIWNAEGAVSMFINAFQTDSTNSVSGPSNRVVRFSANEHSRTISFSPAKDLRSSSSVVCTPLKGIKGKWGELTEPSGSLLAGTILKIVPEVEPRIYDGRKTNTISIVGANGWLEHTQGKQVDVDGVFAEGKASFVSLSGKISRLFINSEAANLGERDDLQVMGGDITAKLTNGGSVQLYGRANAVFRNGSRLNRTHWELFDWPARTLLVSSLGALFLWCLRLLTAELRLNTKLRFFIFE